MTRATERGDLCGGSGHCSLYKGSATEHMTDTTAQDPTIGIAHTGSGTYESGGKSNEAGTEQCETLTSIRTRNAHTHVVTTMTRSTKLKRACDAVSALGWLK